MSNPKTGFDTRAQVAALAASGKQKATQQVSQIAGAISGARNTATNAAMGVAKNASSMLQSRLSGVAGKASAALSGGLGGALGGLLGGGGGAGGLGSLLGSAEGVLNAKLSDTLFSAGPRSDLLTVDAYGIKDSNILNNLVGKISGFDTGALESFRGGSGLTGGLLNLVTGGSGGRLGGALGGLTSGGLGGLVGGAGGLGSLAGGFSLNTQNLTSRVMSSLGGSQGILRSLSSGLGASLTQGFNLTNLVGAGGGADIFRRVEYAVGSTIANFAPGNLTDAQGIIQLVNRLTGDSDLAELYDVGAEATLLSGVFHEVIRYGIPDAISTMVTQASTSQAADYALRSNIIAAVTYSNLDVVELMVDELGVNRVTADMPQAARLLLKNYRLPAGTTLAGQAAAKTKLVNILDKLQPGWGYYNRNGEEVVDLTLFTEASEDAIILLKTIPELYVTATIASTYPPQVMLTQLRSMYPLAVFGT